MVLVITSRAMTYPSLGRSLTTKNSWPAEIFRPGLSGERSEVAPALEMPGCLRSGQLIQGEPVAARRPKRGAGPVRDLEGRAPFPPTRLEEDQRGVEVLHPVDEDRALPLNVVGQENQGWPRGELYRGDARPHRIDCEDHPATQDVRQVRKVHRHVTTRRVKEIELLEGRLGLAQELT